MQTLTWQMAKKTAKKIDRTLRYEKFAAEYHRTGNGTDAYKKAGFAVKTDASAAVGAAQLLRNTKVQTILERLAREHADASFVKTERFELELQRLALSDVRKLYREDGTMKSPHEWDDDTAASVASVEVMEEYSGDGEARRLSGYTKKVRLAPKREAIKDMLARREAAKPPPTPGSSPENPLHVHNTHAIPIPPTAFAAFVDDLRRVRIAGSESGVGGVPPDSPE